MNITLVDFGIKSLIYLVHHSYHSKQVCTMSQWFLDLLPSQALAAELAARTWFDRTTDFQPGLFVLILSRMASSRQLLFSIFSRLVDLARKLALAVQEGRSN